jgi:hypothetical protein
MGVLSVSDLKDGMVLAREVKNKHGNILLKKGDMLSEKHIMLLKSWGVTEADIEGVDRDQVEKKEMDGLSPDLIASVEGELKGLFPDFGDNPLMEELYRVTKKFKMKKVVEKNSGSSNEDE